LNGTYYLFYDSDWYGRDFPVTADLKGGLAKSSPVTSGRFQTEFGWANTPSTTASVWSIAYTMIYRANMLLKAIENKSFVATDDQYAQLAGEAKFLRAFAHFDLVRMYAWPYTYKPESEGVPIKKDTRLVNMPRNTVKEVYDFIVLDLIDAAGMQAHDGEAIDMKAYASADAANALLAKVYLYMGNWTDAATYASKVIAKTDYEMYTAANYASVWGTNAASEVIFEVFGNATESAWGGYDEIGYIYDADPGYGDVCAADKLTSMYEVDDVRGTLFKTYTDHPGYKWPTKYNGKDANLRVNNIVLLRLSEMYLIRCEAVLNGATGDALVDYNMVRTNRGLTAATSVSKSDLYEERSRELCFEGNELFDLARTGRDLVRPDSDAKKLGDSQNITWGDSKWRMPIPIVETDVNELLNQN